jgi:hypothetical protein
LGKVNNVLEEPIASIYRVEEQSFFCCLFHVYFLLILDFNTEDGDDIMTYRSIVRQRLCKHIPAGAIVGKK